MKLLYPEYLWALSAIVVPIIIHLFNFRKFQKVYFSNIDLLKEVKLETKSKSQLKHLVILAIRILAIAALVLAFCQPYIPTNNNEVKGDNVISLYIDNSHSMDSKGENGYRLELAKEQAAAIVSSYGPTDQFQIISNDFEGRHQRLYGKAEAIQLIEAIEPSFQSRKLNDIYLREQDLLSEMDVNKTLYWLSDFQKNATNFEDINPDSSISMICLPYHNEGSGNVYIDSIWFNTPVRKSGTEDMVIAKIKNATENVIDFKLNLSINGENRAFINFKAEANSVMTCQVPFTVKGNGVQHAKLTLEDYPDADLTFDDSFFFSYKLSPGIKIVNLHTGNPLTDSTGYFGVLFGKDPQFSFKNQLLNNFDFSTLNGYDFVLLNGIENFSDGMQSELKNFISNGGSICIFPGDNIEISSYNNLLQSYSDVSISPKINTNIKVNTLLKEHPIYQDIFDEIPSNVDLPFANQYYPISSSVSSGSESLMRLQNGKPFLLYLSNKKGSITICTSPINTDASNFVKHALFVPTMLRLAEFSQYRSNYYNIVGKDNSVTVDSDFKTTDKIEIVSEQDQSSFLPELKVTKSETTLLLYNQIKEAGHYNVMVNSDIIDGLSFNYDRAESSQDFLNKEELVAAVNENEIGQFTKIMENADTANGIVILEIVQGKKYWWHLIVVALILLGLEVAVFRLF
jgi:hypothetical protein